MEIHGKELKIYSMNDTDWVVTPFDVSNTVDWYRDYIGATSDEFIDVQECDLDNEMCYSHIDNTSLDDYLDEIFKTHNKSEFKICDNDGNEISDIKLRDGWQVKVPLRDMLRQDLYDLYVSFGKTSIVEPYIICSTEY